MCNLFVESTALLFIPDGALSLDGLTLLLVRLLFDDRLQPVLLNYLSASAVLAELLQG